MSCSSLSPSDWLRLSALGVARPMQGGVGCGPAPPVATGAAVTANDIRIFAEARGAPTAAAAVAGKEAAATAVAEQQPAAAAVLTRKAITPIADQQPGVLPWTAIADENPDNAADEAADRVARVDDGRCERTTGGGRRCRAVADRGSEEPMSRRGVAGHHDTNACRPRRRGAV